MKAYERLPEVGSVNLLFDQAMYALHDDLARITKVLGDAGVPYELVGGVGVLAHILERDKSRSFVTRDIDMLIRREDLGRLIAVAEAAGYQTRKIVGGYMVCGPARAPVRPCISSLRVSGLSQHSPNRIQRWRRW